MAQLAINGGKPVRDRKWPQWPVFDDEERRQLMGVLESGKWWYGEKVREFEEKFAAFQDARFGITCVNGTAALQAALIGMGVGAGDEVIVPPYTFVATASAVLCVNAIPVFADVDLNTVNLDPADVERKITDKTKAIVPVHFGGVPCDMDVLGAMAEKHNLLILEDACHSWGTKWKGKGTGAIGDAGAFSFQVSKNITSGEGGIVLTDREELEDLIRGFTNIGRIKTGGWYEHYLLGTNLRMTEFQAAVLLAQLTRLEAQTLRREENGNYLDEKLPQFPGICPQQGDARITRRAYHLYIFRFVEEETGIPRDKFLAALKAEGVPASPGYPHPLYKNPLFLKKGDGPRYCPVSCPYYGREMDYSQVSCPNSERICREAVWFVQQMLLGPREDMDDIVRAIEKILEHKDELQ